MDSKKFDIAVATTGTGCDAQRFELYGKFKIRNSGGAEKPVCPIRN
jgi:hypothetical protein